MGNPDKEKQILRAAERLFVSRRFHEVTMDDVSREAGVGKGTVYRYFDNKDDLFISIVLSGIDDLDDIINAAADDSQPLREQLVGVALSISKSFARRKPLFRMMQAEQSRMGAVREDLRRRFKKKRNQLMASVACIISKGAERGEARDDMKPEHLSGAFLSIIRSHLWHGPRRVTRQHAETIVNLFLDGAARKSR